ncbi:melanoma-associated antigen C2-like [Sapajus apella]|uniref:Melanoma-associated antigen C2-like n=1 Tax=Sapajus apella TaxID=9515 RepID=A0A6J3G1J2_SAPAP|nr:melanoma-associated antigen C2-like [Sapajus apella]
MAVSVLPLSLCLLPALEDPIRVPRCYQGTNLLGRQATCEALEHHLKRRRAVYWIPSFISLLIRLSAAPEEVVMPLFPSSASPNSEEDSENPVVIEEWIDAHDPTNDDASSISSSTFYLLCSSSSSSSSSPLILGGPEEEEVSSTGMSSLPPSTPNSPPQGPSQCPPQNPLGSCSSFISGIPFNEEFSSQKEEDTSTFQGLLDSEPLFTRQLDEKVAELVQFLLLKYEAREPITEAEMLMIAVKYKNYIPMIFEKAREFMELLFGLALTEVDPDHFYAFANTGDPTDMGSDDQGTPKNSLLILILSIIFIKGGCASEEAIWEVLNAIGVYAGREHFVYGEPGELLVKVWVEEQYLKYREVPNSSPPLYDVLWGPRAHSESIKWKVLEFLSKLNSTVPITFPSWYKDALKDAEVSAQAIISTTDDATDVASGSFSFMSSNFSHPE